ncbi:MAG: shikimate dehydrogenase, partial [Burkholderiales bacterium]
MPNSFLDTYSGATRVIFIVGDPIAQVKSPAGVTQALHDRGIDLVVVPAHVAPADLPAFFDTARRMRNVHGVIATVPHKFDALALCESVTPRARSIGAINVARRTAGGAWFGDMCDGEGHVAGIRRAGCEPRGKRALLIGAGGAGSAIGHALVDAGVAAIAVHDRDAARCESLAGRLRIYGPASVAIGSDDPTDFDLVVNASPLGMRGDDPLPVLAARLSKSTFVSDVVTMPAVQPLIAAARARGCGTM